MNLELATWSDAATAQLLQVTVVAIAVGIVVRLMARSRPHLAYLLWMLVIVKCLTPPIAASQLGVFSWARAERSPVVESEPTGTVPPVRIAPSAPVLVELPTHIDPPVAEVTSAPAAVVPRDLHTALQLSSAAAIFGAWALGVLTLAGFTRVKWVRFLSHVKRSQVTTPAWLHDGVGRLSTSLGLRRVPAVVVSRDALGPLSMGIWRPTIVLPAALIEESNHAALEPILAHELLHLRRGDVMVGSLQLVAQIVWWFHPLVWWANREARRERERCCDEAVLAGVGCKPNEYAQALINVLDLKHSLARNSLLLVASASDVTDNRLRHIMRPAAKFHRRTPSWCWLVVAVAAILSLPGAGLSLNAEDDTKASHRTNQPVANDSSDEGPQGSDDRKPAVLKFSQRHEEAVKRLRELGAGYSTAMNPRTNRPHVAVSIAGNWMGTTADLRLLADLDLVSDLHFTDGDESRMERLEVLGELDELELLTLMPTTAKALAAIGPLKNLTHLFLYAQGGTSTDLTADEFAPVGRLSQLQHLAIRDISLNDAAMRHIGRLRQLDMLHLENLKITDTGIEALATLDNLRDLYVSGSPWNDERSVTRVTGAGFAKLARLPGLEILHLIGPMITDEGLAGVAQLQGLERLYLRDVRNVTATGIEALGNMTRLKEFSLSGSRVHGDDFAPLAQMKDLRILQLHAGADLGDAGAFHIANLPKLRKIYVSGKGLTEKGLLAIAGLTDLRTLNIPSAQVTASVLDRLAEHPELKELTFDGSQIDDAAVEKLRSLTKLAGLSINSAHITDVGLAKLVRDDRYQYLELDHTPITDAGLAALSGLKNLQRLTLYGTGITDTGLEQLQHLKTLRLLDVTHTNVTEEGVKKLAAALPNLQTFRHEFHTGLYSTDSGTLVRNPDEDILSDEGPDEELKRDPEKEGDGNTETTETDEASNTFKEGENTISDVGITGTIVVDSADEVNGVFASENHDRKPAVLKFSQRHEAAVRRLQELGASYSAAMNPRTKLPRIYVTFPLGWKGTTDDWRLLADLDVVTFFHTAITAGEENRLEVLTNLEKLSDLSLGSPTPAALAKVGLLKGLTTLNLYDRSEARIKLTAGKAVHSTEVGPTAILVRVLAMRLAVHRRSG